LTPPIFLAAQPLKNCHREKWRNIFYEPFYGDPVKLITYYQASLDNWFAASLLAPRKDDVLSPPPYFFKVL
jgi:hypothetical protein